MAVPFDIHAIVTYYNRTALEGTEWLDADGNLTGLNSIDDMGKLLYMQGRIKEAEAHWTEALETRRRTLGYEHPSTLNSIANMGNLLLVQGKYDEAMPYLVEALDGRRRVLGDDDPQPADRERIDQKHRLGQQQGGAAGRIALGGVVEQSLPRQPWAPQAPPA